ALLPMNQRSVSAQGLSMRAWADANLRAWLVGTIACLVHVTLYTLAVFAFTGWPAWALAVVAVTHFIQDRTSIIAWWMRFNGQSAFMQPPLAPWSFIVVDNVWHLVTLHLLSLAVAANA